MSRISFTKGAAVLAVVRRRAVARRVSAGFVAFICHGWPPRSFSVLSAKSNFAPVFSVQFPLQSFTASLFRAMINS
jgi:hypothetical protein